MTLIYFIACAETCFAMEQEGPSCSTTSNSQETEASATVPADTVAISESSESLVVSEQQKYVLKETLEQAPGMRAWILQHVPLSCTMILGNNGHTPLAAENNTGDQIAFIKNGTVYLCWARPGECDVQANERPLRLDKKRKSINACSFRPSGDGLTRVLTTGNDGSARIWHGKTGNYQHVLDHNPSCEGCPAIFDRHDRVLTVKGKQAQVWKIKEDANHKERAECIHQLIGHNKPIVSTVFNLVDTMVATGSLDDSVHLWDTESGKCIAAFDLELGEGSAPTMAFNSIGSQLAVASKGTIMIIDVETGDMICKKKNAFPGVCHSIQFVNGNDEFFETVGNDSCTRRWGLYTLNAVDKCLKDTVTAPQVPLLIALYEYCQKSTEPFRLAADDATFAEQWSNIHEDIKNLLNCHIVNQ